jgi:hypothetical protein
MLPCTYVAYEKVLIRVKFLKAAHGISVKTSILVHVENLDLAGCIQEFVDQIIVGPLYHWLDDSCAK